MNARAVLVDEITNSAEPEVDALSNVLAVHTPIKFTDISV